jgi:glucose-6-phosphate 1-dehydrogenase
LGGLSAAPAAAPAVLVLFGATGDLARRKLYPALFRLWRRGLLPDPHLVGVAREPFGTEEFRRRLEEALTGQGADAPVRQAFAARAEYLAADLGRFEEAGALAALLGREGVPRNRLFYLATPPACYRPVVEALGRAGLAQPVRGGWTRVVVEKPFGTDLASAEALNRCLHEAFREQQVYRIDHYLGKETVQNILVFRFANGLFEPVWNRTYVDAVQITVAESIGLEGRGAYYETAGALRDMVQNHLLQLLCLVAMDPPVAFRADDVRDKKVEVLRSVRPLGPGLVAHRAVRGQYGPGQVDGVAVPGYREEPGVDPESRVETFVALHLEIDSWRWAGVPFFLRTGKRLARRVAEIAVTFKRPPLPLFTDTPARVRPNELVLRIQPEEGIFLSFAAKKPGQSIDLVPVEMDFAYERHFPEGEWDAYERLLLDAWRGDATLFTRADETEAAWRVVDPIRVAWDAADAAGEGPLPYAAGTWGPAAAARLPRRVGLAWRTP